MASQIRKLVLYLLTLFSLFSSYHSLEDNYKVPPYNNHYLEEVVAGYEPQAYPSYFSPLLEDGPMAHSFQRFGKVDDFITSSSTKTKTVVVDQFGAKGNGYDDDTEAFKKAWEEACSSKGSVTLEVPEGNTYLLKPIRFAGPCKSNYTTVLIYGNIEASDDRSDYKDRHWIIFDSVNNMLMDGGGSGIINGKGQIWWQNSCKINKDLAITFYKNKNLVVQNLKVQDAQQIHVSFERCDTVKASNLTVTAPEKSPNTDGIHVTSTQNIQITSCTIGTGDDCISIVSGSKNVQASDITCGPGHGISIGSLGSKNSKAYVSGVTVDGAKLTGTTNGVRIKTWQGGSGSASNIVFQNVEMYNVSNPIIIDQNYCDQKKPCNEQSSAVQVKNVVYRNIKGTSASDVAIKFDCSKTYPCQGILLENVDLEDENDSSAKAVCNNVKMTERGYVSPHCPN
ncbi:Glycoside hydrolase, family 28 [Corchorus capsularis]|uniref:endo-polygalacturonase n=1 Tax=Corchorus capsularis TaxID=210143 RepID=A0A1R3HLM1_COCAP|nr:Glycoside hydrolase, family 28 [Corchorus capsularis]